MSGEVLALVSALLWSVASVLMALGSHRLHVLPLNLIRCVVSSVFFWALLPFYGGLEAFRTVPSSAWLWLVVSVLILLVVGDTLYFRSLNLAGVSWAMPVAGINPLWAILLAALFVDEPLTWSLLLGALLVVAGVTLLSRPEMHSSNGQDIEPAARRKGLLIALLVSLLWGAGQVTLKPATAGMHSVVANSIRQPLAMFILLAINLRTGLWKELRRLDRRSWAMILLASLVGTGVGTLFFVMAIQTLGAGRTAVITSTSPLLAIPFSMTMLREKPTRWTVAGTFFTTVGVVLVA
ncbi:MAG: DMT family transporter [Anaerolineae bacterium]|nr:DMT family transporter [Anaerolineae bacterium]MDX9832558.1 DMT family transporter [Anaerolineae bacterium]